MAACGACLKESIYGANKADTYAAEHIGWVGPGYDRACDFSRGLTILSMRSSFIHLRKVGSLSSKVEIRKTFCRALVNATRNLHISCSDIFDLSFSFMKKASS